MTLRAPYLELWPPLAAFTPARRSATGPPFPFADPGYRLYAKGRHALWDGLRSVGLGGRDEEILVPAFNCGSEVEALVRAGLIPRFYEATETLEPDERELRELISPRTRALLLIHYLGFPQESGRWRAWCDERGLLLVEDCAHAWPIGGDRSPVGSVGDIAVYSLSKTLGLPEGGVLRSKHAPPGTDPERPLGLVAALERYGQSIVTALGWIPPEHRRPFPEVRQVQIGSTHQLAFGRARQASSATAFLLSRMDLAHVAQRRRTNYAELLDTFADRVPLPFRTLSIGACPLVFPIEVSNGPQVADRLRRQGVAARPWWSFLHPTLPVDRFPRALAWHRRFIVVPVHQGLRHRDVRRVRDALLDS